MVAVRLEAWVGVWVAMAVAEMKDGGCGGWLCGCSGVRLYMGKVALYVYVVAEGVVDLVAEFAGEAEEDGVELWGCRCSGSSGWKLD
jgi:hypothetical protein